MQVRTKAEKLMPRRAASSFAASHRASGIRRVTEIRSPFTRKLLISVSLGLLLMSSLSYQASALPSFEMQYKCVCSIITRLGGGTGNGGPERLHYFSLHDYRPCGARKNGPAWSKIEKTAKLG